MSEKLLYQMIDKLSSIETRMDNMESTMLTKDDISDMATKTDIKLLKKLVSSF